MNKKFSTEKFNRLVRDLEAKKVEGINIKEPQVRHPFFIMPSWQNYDPTNPEAAVAVFTLEPAYCGAKEIRVKAKGKYCSQLTKDRIKAEKNEVVTDEKFYDAYLSERPKIIASWRQVGGEVDTTLGGILTDKAEKIPEVFLKMGVSVGESQTSPYKDEGRLLFVTDIWVQHDRWITDVDITFADPFATASLVNYDIKYGYPPNYSTQWHVHTGGPFKPRSTPRTLFEKLLNVQPEAWDALLIGKLWAVSPPSDVKDVFTLKPSPSYQLVEEQMLFWNINYVAPELAPLPKRQAIALNTGLLGGVADQIFNSMLAFVNDTANLAQPALVALENRKGKFFSV
jgi:hypothetical protein